MARLLPAREFAALTALFAIVAALSLGAQVIQASTARISARYRAGGAEDPLKVFVARWWRRIVIGAGIAAVAVVLLSDLAATALALPPASVGLIGVALLVLACLTFTGGLLQGFGLFGWLGSSLVLQAGVRLALGVVLVAVGLGVDGAFAGLTAGLLLGLLANLIPLRSVFGRPPPIDPPGLARAETVFFLRAGLVLLAYGALANMDAALARTLLRPDDAGAYAGAVTMGKVIFFAPIAVGFVLLERTARAHARGDDTTRPLLVAIGLVLLTSGVITLAYLVAPVPLTRLVLGDQYATTADFIGVYAIVSLSNALLGIWNAYFIGRGEMRIGFLFLLVLVVEIVLLLTYARDIQSMVSVVLGITLAMQIGSLVAFKLQSRT